MNDELHDMLLDQLRDAVSAEKQAVQLMKKTLRKVSDPELKEGLQAHIEQSEHQRERVEETLRDLGGKPGRKVCEAMRGLSEEAQHELEEHDRGPILDLVIVAAQQRVEHYEIAAYGTMAELARAMGHEDAAETLGEILQEEKDQDQRLTELTRETLLPELLEGDEEEEDDEEYDEDEEEDEEEEAEVEAGPARGGRRR